MATEFGSGGCSKKRRTDEEGEQAAEEDRISALPEALQLHILGLLPLKSAIRTGALSTQWRGLWTRRWPAPASLDFRLAPHDSPQPLMESLERRGRRRLDRFSLSFQIGQLNAEDFKRCLGYAAACAVADLDVYLSNPSKTSTRFVNFPLPPFANPHLARLSLTGIRVGHLPYYDSRPYLVLEVIHLHRVTISDETLFNLVAACPLLRTLDIRYCELRCAYLTGGGDYLKNLTIVECDPLNGVFIDCLTSLRSFRYSGAYLAAYEVPTSSPIDDLYICFGGPAGRWLRPRRIMYDARWRLCKVRGCWLDTLISLSSLSVLTLCSSALRRVSAKARSRSIAGDAASCRLLNLREVQLLMFATYNENMDDIMAFLVTCCTPLLERLFVQLPTRSDQYKPEEEPSESEEELSEEEPSESEEELSEVEASEEDQSEQKESEEGSEEDHAYENESDEDGPEEDHSQEYDSEEDHSQGDSEENHSEEDDSEEDYSQKGDSEESHSQEDESEEQGSEEDHPKENGSEEQEFAEAQSKEDGSKREFSDGGQSAEEPLGDCWENLMLLKMTNFMGHHNEMELVSFVLKKSACLNQLILFTPERVHPGGPQKDHPSTSSFLETKLLALEKASPNAQIILSAPDVAATKPFHSETFVKILEKTSRSPNWGRRGASSSAAGKGKGSR